MSHTVTFVSKTTWLWYLTWEETMSRDNSLHTAADWKGRLPARVMRSQVSTVEPVLMCQVCSEPSSQGAAYCLSLASVCCMDIIADNKIMHDVGLYTVWQLPQCWQADINNHQGKASLFCYWCLLIWTALWRKYLGMHSSCLLTVQTCITKKPATVYLSHKRWLLDCFKT